MNRFMQEKWSWLEGLNAMRDGVLEVLEDSDLLFNPGGLNEDLGALFRENGEIEYSYIQSLKTYKQDWSYSNTTAGLDRSVSQLKAWFQTMDADLKSTVAVMSDEDLTKTVMRSSGYEMPVKMQFEVYMQALFIFLGKATVYLRAMNKPLPPAVQEYIG